MNVEDERQKLIDMKRDGTFSLEKQLAEHPLSALVRKGLIRLPDDHPLMKLRVGNSSR